MSNYFSAPRRAATVALAREREWTVRNMRKIGARGLMTITGCDEASKYIGGDGGVVLIDQNGEDYLFAVLDKDFKKTEILQNKK